MITDLNTCILFFKVKKDHTYCMYNYQVRHVFTIINLHVVLKFEKMVERFIKYIQETTIVSDEHTNRRTHGHGRGALLASL